ncbi:MAG: helix-turn-helix transcriptional regulator [Acidobacteriota bacterium]
MRRKKGTLVPLEVATLEAAIELRDGGDAEFHGFLLAKHMEDADGAKRLTAHGTLYRSLARLERAGLLDSRWEDPQVAADEGRPLRRLYRVTADGEAKLAEEHRRAAETVAVEQRGAAT